jgi:integrase
LSIILGCLAACVEVSFLPTGEWAMIYKRGCDKEGPNLACSRCGERGACGVYWYKFMWHGKLIRETTHQGNDKVARQMESAHRTSLAKGEVGIRERKPVPTLGEFIEIRFEPWAKSTFEKTSPKTWFDWYRVGLRAIQGRKVFADLCLNDITSETIAGFAAYRHRGRQISTVNSTLRVLRRILGMAVEWGVLEAVPKVKMLPGERHRDRVVTPEEEASYLAVAPEALASIMTVLIDTGLRPDECFRLRWESITWTSGRHGTLFVSHGKTAAARRLLPITKRVRDVLESHWKAAGKPSEGWLWPAATKSGHIESSSLKKKHAKVFVTIATEAKTGIRRAVRPFVLYSLRHTFLTRLGESGCDVWTLARIAGHSSIRMSARYVHPSGDAVLNAMARFAGGHKIGHSAEQLQSPVSSNRP